VSERCGDMAVCVSCEGLPDGLRLELRGQWSFR
jgi:hypothetical protein